MFNLGMCIAHNQTTAFDAAVEWVGRARVALGRASRYLAHVDFQAGSVAMARGRTGEARTCYDRALRIARASHLRDAGAVMIAEALAAELELERSAGAPRLDGPQVSPQLLGKCIAWLDVYAASIGVRAELALLRGGPQAALAAVDDAREYARPALARFLSALRVSVLLAGGEVDEAARALRRAKSTASSLPSISVRATRPSSKRARFPRKRALAVSISSRPVRSSTSRFARC